MHQQSGKQRGVHAGPDGEMQVGFLRGRGAARIDHDELRTARAAILKHALKENRMTPCGIRTDQHDQIGKIEILVKSRHRVGPEGALVACHGRRHAEPRIGVDIG